jgi:ribosomal protein L29
LLAAETESADVTQLRFDKAASESKYRKLLHRCQELEEEKGTCLAVLRRNQQSIDDKDFVECIVSVCDQLTSDLSQRSSLSSELEDAVKAKRLLETTVRDQSLLIESLQTEREKSSLVSGRIQDLQDKLHHLEQENFTLMTEKKELKKKCQKTLKELTVLRTKVSDGDDVTMDLQRLKQNVATSKPADNNRGLHNLERKHASSTSLATSSPYASRALKQRQVDTKPPRQQHHTDLQSEAPSPLDLLCSNFATSATGSGRKPDVTVNDENARNRDVFSLDNITGSSSKSKQRSAPELGESHPAAASNENTADCAQS